MSNKLSKDHVLILRITDPSKPRLKMLKTELVDRMIDLKDSDSGFISSDTDWGFTLDDKEL